VERGRGLQERERNISCPHAGNGSKDSRVAKLLMTRNLPIKESIKSDTESPFWVFAAISFLRNRICFSLFFSPLPSSYLLLVVRQVKMLFMFVVFKDLWFCMETGKVTGKLSKPSPPCPLLTFFFTYRFSLLCYFLFIWRESWRITWRSQAWWHVCNPANSRDIRRRRIPTLRPVWAKVAVRPCLKTK
jgi:hypothetical protein